MSSLEENHWRIREWFPTFDERIYERLRIYHLELLRWTKKINLISPSSAKDADLVHFADAILAVQFIFSEFTLNEFPKEIWDLGSGNGFPGVVACILRPALGVVCVESDERKAAFLRQLGMRLELDSLGVRQERVEKLPGEAINIALCRGFAPLDRALGAHNKQFQGGGVLYSLKGPEWVQEAKGITGKVAAVWESSLLKEYKLSFGPEKLGEKVRERAIFKSVKKMELP
jgi:16S rRNA (guanine527-N7)-methyltransferase